MSSKLCIHGHFYQPPRFDPWLEEVLPEAGAAPFKNWNERINRECYYPLAYARRMDSNGLIFNIINCYEYMSFNFGPTILSWLEKNSPDTYSRILEGDRKSAAHFGRGNAMAQVYHHIIMPLSTDQDRDIEIHWSIADFEHRYGRKPEGMWLAETAVCTDTLEALARAGLTFTILAPRQAEAVSNLEGNQWKEVSQESLETDRPYLVRLPSGNNISVFFYDGPLSQAVAFERLLSDGREFWNRLLTRNDAGLLSLATDGESYGHHFKFGEMALAYMLEQTLSINSPLKLTNFASHLAENPPTDLVRIREMTSWSCIHGLERWRDDCGCTDGGHPEWNQRWRKPLRRALNLLKYYIDEHFRTMGADFFRHAPKALLDYGRCLCGALDRDKFISLHQHQKLGSSDKVIALKLLEMQRAGLAAFSSCAWFFDDIARIEPLNNLSYALKGMEMLRELNGPDVEGIFLEVLEEGYSNQKNTGDGKKIWTDLVLPRKIAPEQMALISLGLEKPDEWISFPGLSFRLNNHKETLSLEYEWNKTGEKGEKHFIACKETGTGDLPGIINQDKSVFPSAGLNKKLKDYILCRQDRKREDALWSLLLEQASFFNNSLFEPFDEGQKSPLTGMGIMSPGIVYMYLKTDYKCAHFENFWKDIFKYNPFFRDIIAQKISLELDSLTRGPDPQISRAADLIYRSRNMNIYPDLFIVQNRLWLMGLEAVNPELSKYFFLGKSDKNED